MNEQKAKKMGPAIESMMAHLARCPEFFLHDARTKQGGFVHVDAVVGDLLRLMGKKTVSEEDVKKYSPSGRMPKAKLQTILVVTWLLSAEWFRGKVEFLKDVEKLLAQGLDRVSEVVKPLEFVQDGERREELARLCLMGLGLLPEGENEDYASQRAQAIDSVERTRVMREAAERIKRAAELRKKLEEDRAREAADKWNRE